MAGSTVAARLTLPLSRLGCVGQMDNENPKTRSVLSIVLFAILAAILFFVLFPSIQETRLESRVGLAYRTVCQLAESDVVDGVLVPESSDIDPWGQPYEITKSPQGLVVVSNGPNQTTPSTGYDRDDIYSDMTHSPIDTIHQTKRWQMLAALSMPAIWLIGTVLYLKLAVQNNSRISKNA